MADRQPISTAPRNGSKVTVYWTDADGQENESIAQFRSLDRLRAGGGEWEEADAGWWVYVDGDTQKRVEPTGCASETQEDED
ncbi:hypothetical protein [Mesorhizobium sp. CAU 1732]|uniref:hypothetical protein n=1 Tax=Mesorhizobium sp. CAU 1732 TaxID=3140358 RepID=UPI0032615C57